MPLTLLAQPTGTTICNPGGVEHPQRAIGFSALFGRAQHLARGAAQRAISLGSKVAPREAPGFPGQASLGGSVAKGASGALRRLWKGWSKLGGAQGRRLKLMAQLQAQVPDPL